MCTPGLIFLISGPSGVGKTTLCKKLLERYPNLRRAVTTTSRPMRQNEQEGVDYYFISDRDFEKGIQQAKFYEYAKVHGQWKGVYRYELLEKLESGIDVLLNVDVQGAELYRKLAKVDDLLKDRLVTIFILPPSIEDLKARLKGRGDVLEAEGSARIEDAMQEIKYAKDFHFRLTSGSPEDDILQLEALYCQQKILQRMEPQTEALQ